MVIKIFGFRLKRLAKCGALTDVKKFLGSVIDEQNFMGAGDDASCFRYKDDQVIKLCTKEVKYFKHFGETDALNFQKVVSHVGSIFLPINEVLYQDQSVFVYTQPICQKFNLMSINLQSLQEILHIEKTLLEHGLRASTSPHNLAIYKGRVVVFDYHDVSPLVIRLRWRQEVVKHLLKFLSVFYMGKNIAPKKFQEFLKDPRVPAQIHQLIMTILDETTTKEQILHAWVSN